MHPFFQSFNAQPLVVASPRQEQTRVETLNELLAGTNTLFQNIRGSMQGATPTYSPPVTLRSLRKPASTEDHTLSSTARAAVPTKSLRKWQRKQQLRQQGLPITPETVSPLYSLNKLLEQYLNSEVLTEEVTVTVDEYYEASLDENVVDINPPPSCGGGNKRKAFELEEAAGEGKREREVKKTKALRFDDGDSYFCVVDENLPSTEETYEFTTEEYFTVVGSKGFDDEFFEGCTSTTTNIEEEEASSCFKVAGEDYLKGTNEQYVDANAEEFISFFLTQP